MSTELPEILMKFINLAENGKDLGSIFFSPYQSKLDFTKTLFGPVIKPAVYLVAAAGCAIGAVFFAVKFIINVIGLEPAHAKVSLQYCGLSLALALVLGVLASLGPILGAGILVGRSIAHLQNRNHDSHSKNDEGFNEANGQPSYKI